MVSSFLMCLLCFLFIQIKWPWWFGVSRPLIRGFFRTIGNLHRGCVESKKDLVRDLFRWFSVLLPTFLLACLGHKVLVNGDYVTKCRSLFSTGDRPSWFAFRLLFFLRPWGVSALCAFPLDYGFRWYPEDSFQSQGDEFPRRLLGSCCRFFSEAISCMTSKDEIMEDHWSRKEVCHSQGDESPRLFIGFCCWYFSEASSIKKTKDECFPLVSGALPSKIVEDSLEVQVRGQTVVVRHQHDDAVRCIYLVLVYVVSSSFMFYVVYYRYGPMSRVTAM